jgi:hypothetical protein
MGLPVFLILASRPCVAGGNKSPGNAACSLQSIISITQSFIDYVQHYFILLSYVEARNYNNSMQASLSQSMSIRQSRTTTYSYATVQYCTGTVDARAYFAVFARRRARLTVTVKLTLNVNQKIARPVQVYLPATRGVVWVARGRIRHRRHNIVLRLSRLCH